MAQGRAAAAARNEAITPFAAEEGDAILVFPSQSSSSYHAEWEQTAFLSRMHFKVTLRMRIMMYNFIVHIIDHLRC